MPELAQPPQVTSTPAAGRAPSGLWRTVAALSLVQFGLHLAACLVSTDPHILMPHAVAWLHDVVLLCAVAAITVGPARVTGATLRRVVEVGGRCALVALGMVLSIYPQMLQLFMAVPLNFLEADGPTAAVFVRDYLGIRVLWPAAVALGAGILAPRVGLPRLVRRSLFVGIPLAAFTLLTLLRNSPNPVVFGLQDSVCRLFVPREIPRLRVAAGEPLRPAAVDWSPAAREARYDHVVFAVLEGVTSAEFEAEFRTRAGGFLDRHRSQARYFSRWHSTNLDSYPALLAMTTSVQVPFRAYSAPERYQTVNDAPNLVQGLRAAGFRTLFISTYEHQPFIPNRQNWDRLLDRRDLGDLSPWVSLGSNRMETATEDRAGLPTIVDFMKSSPRSLVMAELVYGHSPVWRVKMGMTSVEYYDRYLGDLWDRLTQAQLAARTLLVVVSDHGDRSRAAVPDNYRVPLLVVGEGVESGEEGAFRSHLDLQALVAHFLLGTGVPSPREEVFTVGSTERWIYGAIRSDGRHLFVDDGTGRVLAGSLDARSVHDSFQAYVASFCGAFVR